MTLSREAADALDAVDEAALALESQRAYGKSVGELMASLAVLAVKVDRARRALEGDVPETVSP